jgi:hypothetical protein
MLQLDATILQVLCAAVGVCALLKFGVQGFTAQMWTDLSR